MDYFWNRKRNSPDRPEETSRGQDENHNAPTHQEPTERTSLLRDNNQAYLSPDDPAVSEPLMLEWECWTQK